jgi:uncharacterized protein YabN with tetrapyrrole methylase and pyrophosphatase domain
MSYRLILVVNQQNQAYIRIMKKNPLSLSFEIGLKDRGHFDWPNVEAVLDKVTEELGELKESLNDSLTDQAHELGDLLFTIVQVARHLNLDPNLALETANERYNLRFKTMSELISNDGFSLEKLTLSESEQYWKKAKTLLKEKEVKNINTKFGFK